MRVAFDCSPLERPYPPGVRRATAGLLAALEDSGRFELLRLAPEAGEDERRWRHGRLPRLLADLDCAGLHSPVSAFPFLGPGRRVQTVHELPWRHGANENTDLAHRFWAHLGPWRADAVLCPTELVRADLRAGSSHGRERVHVCPWGIDPGFGDPEAARARDLSRYALPDAPFALALGAVRPKKGLAFGLRALATAELPPVTELHLVVTGEETPELRADLELAGALGLRERVHAVGLVDEADLGALVTRASAVLLLSLSEGFGFPALEALACGTPVVVREGSAPAEVAGPCALATRPEEAASVVDALSRALEADEASRARGRERAAEYSWERSAAIVEELWSSWAS